MIKSMDNYVPNPANYVMKGNPIPAAVPSYQPPDLSKLDQMTREELIALIKTVSSALWGYALLSKEEKQEALRLKVYAIAMGSAQDAVTLKAANDWLDREEGKATQRIESKTLVATVDLAKHREAIDRQAEEMLLRLARITTPSAVEGK